MNLWEPKDNYYSRHYWSPVCCPQGAQRKRRGSSGLAHLSGKSTHVQLLFWMAAHRLGIKWIAKQSSWISSCKTVMIVSIHKWFTTINKTLSKLRLKWYHWYYHDYCLFWHAWCPTASWPRNVRPNSRLLVQKPLPSWLARSRDPIQILG